MLPVSVHGCFDEALGIWICAATTAAAEPRPALFLDRDGVIVEDPGYLCRPGDLQMISGAAAVIASANRRGIPVVEVTNQAGIGRGYYTWKEFVAVEERLAQILADSSASVDAILACPYHRDGVPPWTHPAHPARKPGPGMLFAAEKLLNLDLRGSWIVGDKLSDLEAGYQAGLRGGLHVLTGTGVRHRPAVVQWKPEKFDLRLGESIRDAEGLLA
ncbi:MAG TPA: HAD family hydrolase [Bryobacteraceae bacterium]|jgi:D-glycero-D-manno-heptose 1,7-bisphosphate phosphatase